MSLASLAVRLCTIEALRGQTLAGDTIEDSPEDPVSLALAASAPFIVVYSDSEVLHGAGSSLLTSADASPHHLVDLTLHVFVPGDPTITLPNIQPVTLASRESGAALAIDLIYRQMEKALAVNDNTWANLWRRAVLGVRSIEAKAYLLQSDKGVRVPAREIVMKLDVLDNPAFAGETSKFWPDFVAAMQGSDDLQDLAPVVAALVAGDPLPAWRAEAALLGISAEDMAALGLGPMGGQPTDAEVPMSGAAIDPDASGASDASIAVVP